MPRTTRLTVLCDGVKKAPSAIDGVKVVIPREGFAIHVHVTRESLYVDVVRDGVITDINFLTYEALLPTLRTEV